MIKKISILMTCILCILIFSGCSKNQEIITKTALKMDTVFQLKAYGPKANEAIEESLSRLDEIEQMASVTIDSSDISKINQASGKEYVQVHPEIIKMLETAVKYSKLSNGVFDITVGPLVNLWGIGTDNERIPTDEEIKSKLPLVGYNDISINEENNSIKLLKEGMAIDLGGIAKGFAADEVLKIYKEYDIKGGIISLGGSSIYTVGKKPDGTSWNVGVKHPRKDSDQDYVGIINLSEQALSTSGDYERYFIKDGKRYHHILNPSTGYPTDNGVMSVTIVVDSSIPDSNMLADILTKTVFIAGVDNGLKFIDSLQGVSCMAITSDYNIYKSSNWNIKLDKLDPDFKFAN
ncbi:thiamine biosynthesis protein ApbE [Clostridium beijerinckii]|uniref:FAD:protein FMN transferase n=1 Tax=Clostridium beijerinckii TaxID=1520 RepID=A0A0B5QIF8_CLOBE|nr:FAD:protein FMN transferase [Clostridium beijerinckii]AJH00721.1 thiamine biosynthesis protein ApbE [Clostridium beijerinckii]